LRAASAEWFAMAVNTCPGTSLSSLEPESTLGRRGIGGPVTAASWGQLRFFAVSIRPLPLIAVQFVEYCFA